MITSKQIQTPLQVNVATAALHETMSFYATRRCLTHQEKVEALQVHFDRHMLVDGTFSVITDYCGNRHISFEGMSGGLNTGVRVSL